MHDEYRCCIPRFLFRDSKIFCVIATLGKKEKKVDHQEVDLGHVRSFVGSFVRFKLISASTKKSRIPSKLFFRPLPNFDSFASIKKLKTKNEVGAANFD